MTKTWTMNETQKNFIDLLKEYPNGVTLLELKLEKGIEFKTGSINTLIAKKLVTTTEEKEFSCDIVYNNHVVGHCTKKGKIYKLVNKDQFCKSYQG